MLIPQSQKPYWTDEKLDSSSVCTYIFTVSGALITRIDWFQRLVSFRRLEEGIGTTSETERVGRFGTSSWNSNGSNEAVTGGDFVLATVLRATVGEPELGALGEACESWPKTSSSFSSLYLPRMRSQTICCCFASVSCEIVGVEEATCALGDLRLEELLLLVFFDVVLLSVGDLDLENDREDNEGEE